MKLKDLEGQKIIGISDKHPSSCSHCREKCFDDRLIHEIMLRFRQDEL